MQKKIFEILLKSAEPVSNNNLAMNCKLSVNTIRKEITLLNDELAKHGMCIASQPSIGNYIEIIDRTLATEYINHFKELYKRNKRMKNIYSSNVHYLVRKYLSSTRPFTIDYLCQELYCSKGTLLKDIDAVKEILSEYGLTLHNRNRSGLIVEGNEWNIRQCLIYQHKFLRNSMEKVKYDESSFTKLFLGDLKSSKPERDTLLKLLNEQNDFTLPMIYFPKIIHYMQLSYTRRQYKDNLVFTDEQIKRVKNTKEYQFVKKLFSNFCSHLDYEVNEIDIIALSMLILSYESSNNHLTELENYQQYYQETMELVDILVNQYGCPKNIFDNYFIQDWICYLYTLENRLVFNVYIDHEIYYEVEKKGIRSNDFCILFARLYKKNHGIYLDKKDTITAFYLFHGLLKKEDICYYSQNVLVCSYFGLSRAISIARNIRKGYGKEIGLLTPIELGQKIDNIEDYDLIVTDAGYTIFHYFKMYDLPVLSTDFTFKNRLNSLDDYLQRVRHQAHLVMLNDKDFMQTKFDNKMEVFEKVASDLNSQYTKEEIILHLEENDRYIELERNHGIVCLPILMEIDESYMRVFINDHPFMWNQNEIQIIVAYHRPSNPNMNQILNNILEKFVHITYENAVELKKLNENYVNLLYKCDNVEK